MAVTDTRTGFGSLPTLLAMYEAFRSAPDEDTFVAQNPALAAVGDADDVELALLRDIADIAAAQFDDTVISVRFTRTDVTGFAEEFGVPVREATERAESWADAITDTLVTLGNTQLASVIEHNEP